MLHPDARDDLPLQNVPLPHQKAKAVALQRRIARSLKRSFNKCCICSAVNLGYPRLMVQHPARAHPPRAFL